MKYFYVISTLLAIIAVNAEEKYTTENDDLDIDGLVANTADLKSFVGCFMDTEPCNAVAADFKKDIPEAITTDCTKCTQAQKHIFHKFLLGLKEKLPADYTAFKNKFDPEGKHFTTLVAAVANA